MDMSSLLCKTVVVCGAIVLGLAMPLAVRGQEQIPWAANLEEAQRLAGEQHKLLLLHFYNDHCPPCERLEQTVFTQPGVVQAIAKNYIPVKIHAGLQPRVAEHYQVKRWPTDVFCSSAGLEIHRAVSPATAQQYVGLCDAIAMQGGVGGQRQWVSSMQAAGQQVYDQQTAAALAAGSQYAGAAQGSANQAAAAGQGYVAQTNAAVQGYAQAADQQVAGAAQQVNQATQQAQSTASNWSRQLTDSSRQLAGAGQQIGSTVQNTARDMRTQWDPTSLRAPLPTDAGVAGAATTNIYQGAPPAEVAAGQAPPAQPAAPTLPSNNPWIGQQAAPQVAAAPAAEQPAPQATTQPGWQPSGAVPCMPGGQASAEQQLVPASQAPPVALEGYCPVTLLDARQWQKADSQFGAIHRGRTYLFRSAAEQTKFLADPDRYSPVLSGLDAVAFAQRGEKVEGKRSYGLTYNKQIYLFADEASLKAFEASPQVFAGAAHQAMLQVETTQKYR